jgi:hypothetical protein
MMSTRDETQVPTEIIRRAKQACDEAERLLERIAREREGQPLLSLVADNEDS